MALSQADIKIYQGDDYRGVVTVTKGSTPPDQVLAGYLARAQIREGPADVDPLPRVEIGTTVYSPYIYLNIPRSQTAELCDDYVWDLQITSPDDIVETILAGKVRVTSEVTR